MLEKEFQTVLVWNESTAITKDVFLTLMEINQTDLAYVRHQFLFIAHLSTKWKKPCLPWTDFHLGLCSFQFECLRVLASAHKCSSSWMTSLCFQQWEQLKCSSISSHNTSIAMKSMPHNINRMKHKPRTFLLSKSIYSSTKITDSEIMNVITLTFYTRCKKSAVF